MAYAAIKEKIVTERRLRKNPIEVFPGSLQEYERMKGEEYEVVRGRRGQFLDGFDGWTILRDALNVGAVAIVYYTSRPHMGTTYETGVPVRRKKSVEVSSNP